MKPNVLVAGGGIGGLTAACCLLERGFHVRVFEQAPSLSEIGAGIQLSANAMHVLFQIGVGSEVMAASVRPEAYVFRLHDTGEEVGRFALAEDHLKKNGAPYCQLHRADLHAALAARVRALGGDVHLNARIVSIEEGADTVAVVLADGKRFAGEALIGADGVKSLVRRILVGADNASYTGDAAWRLTIPTDKLPKGLVPPVMSVWMGPGRHIVCYYLRAGQVLNFVGLVETDEVSEESWTARFPWQRLKSDFEGWHPIIQTIIDAADKSECFRWSLFYRPPIKTWSRGRVTMLGDAVHATLPYLAQGAAMAIEDGAVLARCLETCGSVAEAFDVYQHNRIERTSKIVTISGQNRDLFHMRDQESLRKAFKNREEGASRNAWLYSYNALTVPLARLSNPSVHAL
jgi:salicylate hydroxylase